MSIELTSKGRVRLSDSLVFFKCFLEWIEVYFHASLFRASATLFQYCLSIRLFCYDNSVPTFGSKIYSSRTQLIAGITSLILSLLVGRIFFCGFGKFCFVRVVWSCLSSIPFLASIFLLDSSSCVFHSRAFFRFVQIYFHFPF